MSQRDLFPRLGGYISSSYTNTPGDEGQLGTLFSLQGGIYLPEVSATTTCSLKEDGKSRITASIIFR